ncbi:Phytanoyl-CoA dioxygenase family protein [Frankia sp. AiPs1]
MGHLREFAERGFVMVPGAVPARLVAEASQVVDGLVAADPPAPDVRGPHNYFPTAAAAPSLGALLTGSGAFALAETLTGPGTLVPPWQVQVALNIPPFPHRPGMHHLDGVGPDLPDGRPGTFTLLAGVLLTDQPDDDGGNLWVWPGTHLTHAEYFRTHGPDALIAAGGYPPIPLPEPEQIRGRAGDLLLAHYLLGHNIGGNTSARTRRAAYYRIKRHGHDARWPDVLRDPWLEYDGIRAAVRNPPGRHPRRQ